MEGKAPQRACSQAKHLLYQNNFIVLIQYCYFVTTDVLVVFFFHVANVSLGLSICWHNYWKNMLAVYNVECYSFVA